MTPDEIRAWRETRGLSQADMAEQLGVKQPTISRWESGEDRPTLPLVRLALERLAQKIRTKRRT
jgi:transcriptional regulator with XRE-family HTH domain